LTAEKDNHIIHATEQIRRTIRQKGAGMKYKCKRCGHEWDGRTKAAPKACPKCKSYKFDQPIKGAK
jgi:predicted Zn-ribbon and HTH transcriptional regulator